ncbi:MAG: SsrA-binding protein SmpB [Polyangiaceae bacterium]|nr:SsrA-binding protein SmpB [Polyangiaceae bacterium]
MTERKQATSQDRVVARNKRARFEYELGETYEAGIALIGSEARALRDRAADLSDSWVEIDQRNEAWLKGMRIPELSHAAFGHLEKRPRKLLLHAHELAELAAVVARDGMTAVATQCYFKGGRLKVEVAVARGRKQHDKRQAIREREAAREAQAAMRRAKRQ